MLTYDRLVELFDLYDNGHFYNRHSRGRAKAGERAGAYAHGGYRRIIIDYVKYYEHHLVWFYVHGELPGEIDHIDGNPRNNAISNLREATRTQNKCNAQTEVGESGLKGAYLDKRKNQWYSKIQFGGQQKFLGNFSTPREAHEAYLVAAERYHGEFALHLSQPPTGV